MAVGDVRNRARNGNVDWHPKWQCRWASQMAMPMGISNGNVDGHLAQWLSAASHTVDHRRIYSHISIFVFRRACLSVHEAMCQKSRLCLSASTPQSLISIDVPILLLSGVDESLRCGCHRIQRPNRWSVATSPCAHEALKRPGRPTRGRSQPR